MRKSRFVRDGDGLWDWIKGAANKVADTAKNVGHKIADTAKTAYHKTIGDKGFQSGFKQGFGNTLGVLGAPAGSIINSFAPGIGTVTGAALSYAGNKVAGRGIAGRGRPRGRGVSRR